LTDPAIKHNLFHVKSPAGAIMSRQYNKTEKRRRRERRLKRNAKKLKTELASKKKKA
jgi:hypothetical protein